MWPRLASVLAWLGVVVIIGGFRHFDFTGIRGFSTTNYAWLAFCLVGGIGLAWRLARPPARWQALLRPLTAAALAYTVCFVMVTVMGLIFLPGQSLAESLTTDAPGRSLPLAEVVAAVGYGCEVAWALMRLGHRRRQVQRTPHHQRP